MLEETSYPVLVFLTWESKQRFLQYTCLINIVECLMHVQCKDAIRHSCSSGIINDAAKKPQVVVSAEIRPEPRRSWMKTTGVLEGMY